MFRCKAAVKHTLLESENPKYLGTDDGMINIGLMTKLYHEIAHNLNEARKARDGNKKGTTPKEPEALKVGDNVLIRDHTSKAFQPKYKDFCIVGLLGKNQIEICQLYEEEQLGKIREGRKSSTNQQNARFRMGHSRNTSSRRKHKGEQSNACLTNSYHHNHHNSSNKTNHNTLRKTFKGNEKGNTKNQGN